MVNSQEVVIRQLYSLDVVAVQSKSKAVREINGCRDKKSWWITTESVNRGKTLV